MGSAISADEARERITSALDAIDAAHDLLRDTPSDMVGNSFRIDVAARLETQERANRGLMYRIFAEIADPPDEAGSMAQMRSVLWSDCASPRTKSPDDSGSRFGFGRAGH
jgi:hypothetical protein